MKMNCCLVLAVMLSTSLTAQQSTTSATSAPPVAATPTSEVTKESPARAGKKTVAAPTGKKKAAPTKKMVAVPEAKPVFLVPGPAVAASGNVNIRGQASLKGEVITRLSQGDTVTVLEEINLEKHQAGEPAQWAKIAFPTNAKVWVNAAFIDANSKAVVPNKLNLRAGPGENYSVVGLLEKGTVVREIVTKDKWMQIETPSSAYAFVAAEFLKQEAPVIAAAAVPSAPAAVTAPAPVAAPTPVAEAPSIAPAPTEAPPTVPVAPPGASVPAVTPSAAPVGEAAPAEPAPVVEEPPPPPRIIAHEGVVRGTRSIQSPTKFEVFDPASGKTIDYLYTSSTNLDLGRWINRRVIVTGEEGLDERWGNTPVITIQRIQLAD